MKRQTGWPSSSASVCFDLLTVLVYYSVLWLGCLCGPGAGNPFAATRPHLGPVVTLKIPQFRNARAPEIQIYGGGFVKSKRNSLPQQQPPGRPPQPQQPQPSKPAAAVFGKAKRDLTASEERLDDEELNKRIKASEARIASLESLEMVPKPNGGKKPPPKPFQLPLKHNLQIRDTIKDEPADSLSLEFLDDNSDMSKPRQPLYEKSINSDPTSVEIGPVTIPNNWPYTSNEVETRHKGKPNKPKGPFTSIKRDPRTVGIRNKPRSPTIELHVHNDGKSDELSFSVVEKPGGNHAKPQQPQGKPNPGGKLGNNNARKQGRNQIINVVTLLPKGQEEKHGHLTKPSQSKNQQPNYHFHTSSVHQKHANEPLGPSDAIQALIQALRQNKEVNVPAIQDFMKNSDQQHLEKVQSTPTRRTPPQDEPFSTQLRNQILEHNPNKVDMKNLKEIFRQALQVLEAPEQFVTTPAEVSFKLSFTKATSAPPQFVNIVPQNNYGNNNGGNKGGKTGAKHAGSKLQIKSVQQGPMNKAKNKPGPPLPRNRPKHLETPPYSVPIMAKTTARSKPFQTKAPKPSGKFLKIMTPDHSSNAKPQVGKPQLKPGNKRNQNVTVEEIGNKVNKATKISSKKFSSQATGTVTKKPQNIGLNKLTALKGKTTQAPGKQRNAMVLQQSSLNTRNAATSQLPEGQVSPAPAPETFDQLNSTGIETDFHDLTSDKRKHVLRQSMMHSLDHLTKKPTVDSRGNKTTNFPLTKTFTVRGAHTKKLEETTLQPTTSTTSTMAPVTGAHRRRLEDKRYPLQPLGSHNPSLEFYYQTPAVPSAFLISRLGEEPGHPSNNYYGTKLHNMQPVYPNMIVMTPKPFILIDQPMEPRTTTTTEPTTTTTTTEQTTSTTTTTQAPQQEFVPEQGSIISKIPGFENAQIIVHPPVNPEIIAGYNYQDDPGNNKAAIPINPLTLAKAPSYPNEVDEYDATAEYYDPTTLSRGRHFYQPKHPQRLRKRIKSRPRNRQPQLKYWGQDYGADYSYDNASPQGATLKRRNTDHVARRTRKGGSGLSQRFGAGREVRRTRGSKQHQVSHQRAGNGVDQPGKAVRVVPPEYKRAAKPDFRRYGLNVGGEGYRSVTKRDANKKLKKAEVKKEVRKMARMNRVPKLDPLAKAILSRWS